MPPPAHRDQDFSEHGHSPPSRYPPYPEEKPIPTQRLGFSERQVSAATGMPAPEYPYIRPTYAMRPRGTPDFDYGHGPQQHPSLQRATTPPAIAAALGHPTGPTPRFPPSAPRGHATSTGPFLEAIEDNRDLHLPAALETALHGQFAQNETRHQALSKQLDSLTFKQDAMSALVMDQARQLNQSKTPGIIATRGGRPNRPPQTRHVPNYSLVDPQPDDEDWWVPTTDEGLDPGTDFPSLSTPNPGVVFTSKLPSAPPFDGKKTGDNWSSFREWWHVFKESIEHFQYQPESRKWALVLLKLKGDPQKYWQLLRDSKNVTFKEAIRNMMANWDLQLRPWEKLDKLRAFRMGPKMTAQEYCRQFLIFVDEHYNGEGEGLNAPVVRESFLNGLPAHIRSGLSHALGEGIQYLMEQAVIIDKNMGTIDPLRPPIIIQDEPLPQFQWKRWGRESTNRLSRLLPTPSPINASSGLQTEEPLPTGPMVETAPWRKWISTSGETTHGSTGVQGLHEGWKTGGQRSTSTKWTFSNSKVFAA